MPETPIESFTRKARLEDFFPETKPTQNQNQNQTYNVEKNQQEFGNRKRIKP